MYREQRQLEERLDSIIGKTYDLLALRNTEETAETLLKLFDQATSLKAKLNEEASNRLSQLDQLKQAAQMSRETYQESEENIKLQQKRLKQSVRFQTDFSDLLAMMYESLAELKGIESLMATQKLLKKQIVSLQTHLEGLSKTFQQQWSDITNSQFENTVNKNLEQTKVNLTSKVEQKERQLEAIKSEQPRVEGEYKSILERYNELLKKQNQRKVQQIKNFDCSTRTAASSRRYSYGSDRKPLVVKGQIEVRYVKVKASNQIEYGIAVILLIVSLCFVGGYYLRDSQ